jgi:hypothetical protein
MQRKDGGWSPTNDVAESTWVTAPAVLALETSGALQDSGSAVEWLLAQTGRETNWIVRLRQTLLGVKPDHSVQHDGWPWFPGAAAWVMPSALTILALASLNNRQPQSPVASRIDEGRKFLLDRMCHDSGWNHGSSRALGYDGTSYPETTGIALLALKGANDPALSRAVACARRHLSACASASAAGWLKLGLLAHGVAPEELRSSPAGTPRVVVDVALTLLAEQALEGRNVLPS